MAEKRRRGARANCSTVSSKLNSTLRLEPVSIHLNSVYPFGDLIGIFAKHGISKNKKRPKTANGLCNFEWPLPITTCCTNDRLEKEIVESFIVNVDIYFSDVIIAIHCAIF